MMYTQESTASKATRVVATEVYLSLRALGEKLKAPCSVDHTSPRRIVPGKPRSYPESHRASHGRSTLSSRWYRASHEKPYRASQRSCSFPSPQLELSHIQTVSGKPRKIVPGKPTVVFFPVLPGKPRLDVQSLSVAICSTVCSNVVHHHCVVVLRL